MAIAIGIGLVALALVAFYFVYTNYETNKALTGGGTGSVGTDFKDLGSDFVTWVKSL